MVSLHLIVYMFIIVHQGSTHFSMNDGFNKKGSSARANINHTERTTSTTADPRINSKEREVMKVIIKDPLHSCEQLISDA